MKKQLFLSVNKCVRMHESTSQQLDALIDKKDENGVRLYDNESHVVRCAVHREFNRVFGLNEVRL